MRRVQANSEIQIKCSRALNLQRRTVESPASSDLFQCSHCGADPQELLTAGQVFSRMAGNLGFLVLLLSLALICQPGAFNPISDSHRSVALELFTPTDGSLQSLQETFEALRTFEVLGVDKKSDIKAYACPTVVDTLRAPSSALQDLFQALRVNGILKCKFNDEAFAGIASRLKDSVKEASTLFDFYYSIGSLKLIKHQTAEIMHILEMLMEFSMQ